MRKRWWVLEFVLLPTITRLAIRTASKPKHTTRRDRRRQPASDDEIENVFQLVRTKPRLWRSEALPLMGTTWECLTWLSDGKATRLFQPSAPGPLTRLTYRLLRPAFVDGFHGMASTTALQPWDMFDHQVAKYGELTVEIVLLARYWL